MNRLRIYTAVILALLAGMLTLTACKKKLPDPVITTTEQVSTTKSNGYTYNDVIFTMEPVSEYIHVVPPVPTRQKIDKIQKTVENKNETVAEKSTTQANQSDKVDEISKGVHILSKTSPVLRGNDASIIIMGTPGATYTIEFYETETRKAEYSGLEKAKADTSGIASWNFTIEDNCEPGERKVIIREKNSDKYIQTLITVY